MDPQIEGFPFRRDPSKARPNIRNPTNLKLLLAHRRTFSKVKEGWLCPRLLTHVDALFLEASACATVGSMSKGHNPRQKPRFPTDPCSFAVTRESVLVPFLPLTCMLTFGGFTFV